MAPVTFSRRDILKAGGALVVGFAFGGVLPRSAGAQIAAAGKPLDPAEVDSFLAFHADGTVTIYTGKVDVGTGFRIAVAQMAAEELGIPAQRITVVDGDTGVCPDQGGTGGSTGLTRGGADVRQAAATARQALLALGATRLNRAAGDLTITDGDVRPASGGAGVSIASLVGDRLVSLKVDPKAPLRSPSAYTVVGQPIPRPDVPAKCTGRHTYVHDFTLPGMLHARVIRPAAIGAALESVDESSIRGIPDVRLVRIESFLALVGKDEWSVVKAAGALKTTWSEGRPLPGSDGLDRWTRTAPIDRDQAVVNRGNAMDSDRSRGHEGIGNLLLAVPEPRVVGPVLRGGRREGRRRNRLVLVTRHAWPAREPREDICTVPAKSARRLSRRRRVVRHERRRPRRRRRGAPVETDRAAGACAVDAAG